MILTRRDARAGFLNPVRKKGVQPMPNIHAAIYDPQTGQVTATAIVAEVKALARAGDWVEIPPGIELDDPGAWRVDLETGALIEAGRVIWADEFEAEVQAFLAASDWTQLGDVPLTGAERLEWREFRTALRDLRNNYVPRIAPAFPELPAKGRTQVAADAAAALAR